jgi:hypothetical protein
MLRAVGGGPIGLTQGVMEPRLAIKLVQIGIDELAVLHANAGVVDEIWHVFASSISTRSSSLFSTTTMRAGAYGDVYVT